MHETTISSIFSIGLDKLLGKVSFQSGAVSCISCLGIAMNCIISNSKVRDNIWILYAELALIAAARQDIFWSLALLGYERILGA